MGCSSSRSSSPSATAAPISSGSVTEENLDDHDLYEIYCSQGKGNTPNNVRTPSSGSGQQRKRRDTNSKTPQTSSSSFSVPSSSSSSSSSPVPFWVIKTRNSEDHKVFVNVCGTTIVGKTSNFSTPVMKVLSPIEDIDKKNDGAFVYDALLNLEDCEFLSKTHSEFGDIDGFWTEINKAIISGINTTCGDELNCENLSYPLLINKYKGSHVRLPNGSEGKSSKSKPRRNSLSRERQLEAAELVGDINVNLFSSSSSSSPSSSFPSMNLINVDDAVHAKKLPTASPTPRRATATTLSLLTPVRKSFHNNTQPQPPQPPSSTDSRGIERSSYMTYSNTILELQSKIAERAQSRGRAASHDDSSASSSSGQSFNSGLGSDDDNENEVVYSNVQSKGDNLKLEAFKQTEGTIVDGNGNNIKKTTTMTTTTALRKEHFDDNHDGLRMIPRGVSVAI